MHGCWINTLDAHADVYATHELTLHLLLASSLDRTSPPYSVSHPFSADQPKLSSSGIHAYIWLQQLSLVVDDYPLIHTYWVCFAESVHPSHHLDLGCSRRLLTGLPAGLAGPGDLPTCGTCQETTCILNEPWLMGQTMANITRSSRALLQLNLVGFWRRSVPKTSSIGPTPLFESASISVTHISVCVAVTVTVNVSHFGLTVMWFGVAITVKSGSKFKNSKIQIPAGARQVCQQVRKTCRPAGAWGNPDLDPVYTSKYHEACC